MRNYEVLLKSNWFAKDIQEFLDCSIETAIAIKNKTQELFGCISADEHKERCSVSGDNVIKVLGGIDRLTEAKIYNQLGGKNEG